MDGKIGKRSVVSTMTLVFAGAFMSLGSFGSLPVSGLLPSGVAEAGVCNLVAAVGQYGFEAQGETSGGPLAAVGQIDLDGTGDASLVGYFTESGYTQAVQYYGSYSVNADCSATISLHSGSDGTDVNFRAQFVRVGLEFKFIIEESEYKDITVSGEAVRTWVR